MPVRPLHEAQMVINAYVPSIVAVIEECHSDYIRAFGSMLHALESRTKAGIVRDLIVDKLRSWADVTPGVQFFRKGNLCWFGFRNNWIARIKMLDDRFHVGVSPTDASDQYNRNAIPDSVQGTLLQGEAATLVYLGWRTTENAPLNPEVAIVCNNEYGEPHWIWPLRGDEPPPALALPTPDRPDGDDGAMRIRVKAKKKSEKEA